jgi:hypothetical protein
MKTRDRAAHDGNETKRPDFAGYDRAAAVDETGEWRKIKFRVHETDAGDQDENPVELDIKLGATRRNPGSLRSRRAAGDENPPARRIFGLKKAFISALKARSFRPVLSER